MSDLGGWYHGGGAWWYSEGGQAAPPSLRPSGRVAEVEAEAQRLGKHQAAASTPLMLHSHQLTHVVLQKTGGIYSSLYLVQNSTGITYEFELIMK